MRAKCSSRRHESAFMENSRLFWTVLTDLPVEVLGTQEGSVLLLPLARLPLLFRQELLVRLSSRSLFSVTARKSELHPALKSLEPLATW